MKRSLCGWRLRLLDFKRTDLWLGSETLSTLHFDNYENLFAQLVGEKALFHRLTGALGLDLGQDFLLCPPGDTPLLADGRLRKAYATWEGRAVEVSQKKVVGEGGFQRKARQTGWNGS